MGDHLHYTFLAGLMLYNIPNFPHAIYRHPAHLVFIHHAYIYIYIYIYIIICTHACNRSLLTSMTRFIIIIIMIKIRITIEGNKETGYKINDQSEHNYQSKFYERVGNRMMICMQSLFECQTRLYILQLDATTVSLFLDYGPTWTFPPSRHWAFRVGSRKATFHGLPL